MIDVLLVTALKEEHDAARDVAVSGWAGNPGVAAWESHDLDTPTPYLRGDYVLAGGGRFSVALARPTRMGAVATAPVISALAERLRPRCLAMSGVCAGNPGSVALGDVIVAESAYTCDEGRRTADGFEGDHRQFVMRNTWIRAAQDLSPAGFRSFVRPSEQDAKVWLLERLSAGEDPRAHPALGQYFTKDTWVPRTQRWTREGLLTRDGAALSLTKLGRAAAARARYDDVQGPARLPFRIAVGPMASGSVVVKDGATWTHLMGLGVRTVLGLEMEAATVAGTAHRLGVENWAVVKGVMDHADGRKDDRYKRFAARASAEVLFAMLAAQLPDRTRADAVRSPTAGPDVVPRQLPLAPPSFVGRTRDLSALTALIAGGLSGGRTRVAAVVGPGGSGKTWAAVHWAHRHTGHFPDGQLYLDLRGTGPPEEAMSLATAVRCLLDALGADPRTVPAVLDSQIGLYRSLIADRRALIVLDNARDAAQVTALLPGSASCAVLVTSRNRMDGLVVSAGARQVELGELPEPEARLLFTRQLGEARVANEPEAVAALLDYCAGLPLALGVVVHRALAQSSFPLAELAAELSDVATRVEAFDSGDASTSLDHVLSWSYRALTDDEAAAFRLLGLAPGPDIGSAAAALLMRPPHRVRALLRALEQRSLIHQRHPGRWQMHALVKLYAAGLVDEPAVRDAATVRLADHYLHSAYAADRVLQPDRPPIDVGPPAPGSRPEEFATTAAAVAWFTAEYAGLTAAMRMAVARGRHRAIWQFAWAMNSYQWRQGHLTDQVACWRSGLAAARELGDDSRSALAHRLLGTALSRAGRPDEAMEQLQRAYRLGARLPDPQAQAATHRSLARAYERRGDHRAALEHATTALALFRSAAATRGEADALDLICWLQARMGRFADAEAHGRAALALYRECQDRDGEATVLDTMGYIADRTGRFTAARDYYVQALALFDGHNAYHEASTLDRLAAVHARLGEPALARSSWERARERFQAQHRLADADRVTRQMADLP